MRTKTKYTIFLENFDLKQEDIFGLKAKSFYDLVHLSVSVPVTFFINSGAFDDFIHENNLKDFIVDRLLKVNIDNSRELEKTSKEIKDAIIGGKVSQDLEEELSASYSRLSGFSDALVSVTYSPINGDLDYSSFSEKSFVFLNIKGIESLIDAVKQTWATLFEPKAIFYREAKRYSGALTIGVVVQKLPFAESSGILFTTDPITNDPTKAQIEAILGVIDPLINSDLTPDIYTFDKTLSTVTEKNTVTQNWMLVRRGRIKENESPHTKVNISPVYKKLQKIDDNYIDYLGKLAITLDKYNKIPLEVEWMLESGRINVTNIKPMTTLAIKDTDWKFAPTVTALKSKLESGKKVEETSVLMPVQGGPVHKTSYEEQMVEASESIPDKGDLKFIPPGIEALELPLVVDPHEKNEKPKMEKIAVGKIATVTKVFYQVKSASEVEKISELPIDGVITQFSKGLLDKGIVGNLLEAASRAGERPVIFSLYSDGSVDESETKKQLTTLKLVRNKSNKKNVWLAIPAYHDKEEIIEVKKLISTVGLKRSSTFKIFVNINSPAAAMQINEFIDIGIDGIMINYSKFAALSLDRNVEAIKSTDLLKHNAIEKILKGLIIDINKSKIDSVIMFDYLELDEQVLTKMVEIGAMGISTHLTASPAIKKNLQSIEAEKILTHKGRKIRK